MYVVRDPDNPNPRESTLPRAGKRTEQLEPPDKVKKVPRKGMGTITRLRKRMSGKHDDDSEVRTDGYYITDTFHRRECKKFVEKSATDTDCCKCGVILTDHNDEAQNSRQAYTSNWDPIADTNRKPTDAYGEIDFLHAENDVLPLYLRCDMEVDIEELGNLLLKKWAMPLPNLIISVFGGHSKFDSKKMTAESDIKEGLVKAARDTKAWIFTSGVNHGVSNLVGDAVAMKRSFVDSIPVIGVNSWGAVSNNSELVDEKEQGLFPAKYNAVPQVELERDPTTNKPKSMSLEHEHTHFILVDFGTKNNFHENDVRRFRITLQEYLVERTQAQLVSVLIEGGCGSLEEAQIRVRSGLPVVILGDSGRISNVLSLAVELSKDERVCDGQGVRTERKLQNEDDRMKVRQALTAALPRLEESKYDELMGIVEEVILHEDLVTVWRCDKGADLDTTILQALIKSIASTQPAAEDIIDEGDNREEREVQRERAKELMKRQLELAIQWDRLDIATEYIFENKSSNARMDLNLTESELNEMLNLAINHKQIRFIRNIIERNANIKTFLTVGRFETILRKNTPTKCLFHELMQKKCADRENWSFEHFAEVVHDISEGVFKVPGKTRQMMNQPNPADPPGNGFPLESIRICGPGRSNGPAYEPVDNVPGDARSARYDFIDPASLLTVYMVLIHEQDMAKVIWEFSNTPLFLGMVCTRIHKWMSDQEKQTLLISDAMAERLDKYSEEFELISEKVLEEVTGPGYKTEHVIALINFKFVNWGGKTILEMADYVNAVSIIAHPTIQDYIDVEWNGWLDSDMSTLRLIVSIFCPLLASFRDKTPFDKWKRKNLQTKNQKCRDSRQAFIDRGVGKDESEANEKLGLTTKCKYFYKAPITKFTIYSIVYGAFLFAYVCALLLADRQDTAVKKCGGFRRLFGCKLTISQQFVYIWVLCLIPLEIRQIYFSYPTKLFGKLKMYWSNPYNKNDVVCIFIILGALICRMTEGDGGDIKNTVGQNLFRLLFAFAFILYCLKLCQALQISEQLGPKVMMMHKMLIDLQFFVFLVLIFVIGYGVSTSSIMNPQKFEKFNGAMVFDIFWRPYTNLFGEIGEETIEAVMSERYCEFYELENCTDEFSCQDHGDSTCIMNIYIVKILLGLYMMVAAVLMLNLLVAVFSSTYEVIKENSKTLWKRQKFDLMVEYRSRSPLPVPLSTILHCCRFIKLMFRITCGRLSGCARDPSEEIPLVDVHQRLTITLLEIECRRKYLDKLKVMTEQEVLQSEMTKVSEEVQNIEKRLGDFERKIQQVIDVATHSPSHRRSQQRGSADDGSSDDMDEVDRDGMSMIPELELDVTELSSSENITVVADVATPDMAIVDVPQAWAGSGSKRKESVSISNLKPIDVQRLQRLLKMGKKSRKPEYPGETPVRRSYVKKEYWDWGKIWIHYDPVHYTDVRVALERKVPEIKWHSNVDGDERRSYEGCYEIRNQLPLIPCGRTGLSGRGLLDRYGPNHAALPIITRHAKDDNGEDVILAGKPVFEVLLERRGEIGSLPEIKGVYDDPLPTEVRQILTREEHLALSDQLGRDKLVRRIEKIFKAGILIYRGFLDSEYNTDNSWFEAIIVSYHDTNDNAFGHVTFPEDSKYRWSRVNNWTNINNMYREYLQRAFYARNGYDHITFPPGSSLHHMGS